MIQREKRKEANANPLQKLSCMYKAVMYVHIKPADNVPPPTRTTQTEKLNSRIMSEGQTPDRGKRDATFSSLMSSRNNFSHRSDCR